MGEDRNWRGDRDGGPSAAGRRLPGDEVDPRIGSLDDADPRLPRADLTDLGERPLVRSLEVPPGPLGPSGRRWRPGPRAVMLGGTAVIILAVVSAGLIGFGSVPPASPSPASPSSAALDGLGSPSPTADACTTVLAGMALPAVTLTSPALLGQRRQVATTVARVDDAGFVPPVDRTVEIAAGALMRVEVGDARCVNELRVDLHGVALAGGDALAVGGLVPLSDGRRYTFSAPPAGDWVLRVGLHVAAPAEFAGTWAVYFFRVNSGYVRL